jgi:hypothetical protein
MFSINNVDDQGKKGIEYKATGFNAYAYKYDPRKNI